MISVLFETLLAILIHVAILAGAVCVTVGIWAVYANRRCRIEEQKSAEHFAATDSIRAELAEAEEKPYHVIGGSRRGPERVR